MSLTRFSDRAGVISKEDGALSGLGLSHVQRSDEFGGGFFVNVEGMHHLHCLNLVRKSVYYNYQYYKDLGTHAFKNNDDILRLHVSKFAPGVKSLLVMPAADGKAYRPLRRHSAPSFDVQCRYRRPGSSVGQP